MSGYGLINYGNTQRKETIQGLQQVSDNEKQREQTNKNLKTAHATQKKASIGSGMATGAMIGAQFGGPYGAVIGGVIGGIAGAFGAEI